jgi:hypothetical protein
VRAHGIGVDQHSLLLSWLIDGVFAVSDLNTWSGTELIAPGPGWGPGSSCGTGLGKFPYFRRERFLNPKPTGRLFSRLSPKLKTQRLRCLFQSPLIVKTLFYRQLSPLIKLPTSLTDSPAAPRLFIFHRKSINLPYHGAEETNRQ